MVLRKGIESNGSGRLIETESDMPEYPPVTPVKGIDIEKLKKVLLEKRIISIKEDVE